MLRIAFRIGKWVCEGPLSGSPASERRELCPHRLDQRADTDDVHDPGQVGVSTLNRLALAERTQRTINILMTLAMLLVVALARLL